VSAGDIRFKEHTVAHRRQLQSGASDTLGKCRCAAEKRGDHKCCAELLSDPLPGLLSPRGDSSEDGTGLAAACRRAGEACKIAGSPKGQPACCDMKVLLLNATDGGDGAGRAAYRLHIGLRRVGISSSLGVTRASGADPEVIGPFSSLAKGLALLRSRLDRLPTLLYRHRQAAGFSPAFLPNSDLLRTVRKLDPDVVHLHWINMGFVPPRYLRKLGRPLVWTLHDMWPFTGGCHYSAGCRRFERRCGACPLLGSRHSRDLSRLVWSGKRRVLEGLDLTLVTPSRWLGSCVERSSLLGRFPRHVIRSGIDTDRFKPICRATARDILGLAQDVPLILFGANNSTTDPRKGFDLLTAALHRLAETGLSRSPELLVFGAGTPPDGRIPFPAHYLGRLHDDVSLALLYSAADVFVAPSQEDNLPNTVVEASACGTPCVAFAIGGMGDIIEHEKTGFLAQPYDPRELAHGLARVLEDDRLRDALGNQARKKILAEFSLEKQALVYADLYESVARGTHYSSS
jgi:glycosyltransferase involved in cell wall biosynthesis